jgi:alpha-tubulin suppressor-like RCC1 family protein
MEEQARQAAAARASAEAEAEKAWAARHGGLDDAEAADAGDAHEPKKIVEISVGQHHACGRTDEGAVYCWGSASGHQLGRHLEGSESKQPLRVPGVADVVSLSAALDRTCAVEKAGTLWCWGTEGITVPGFSQTKETERPTRVVGVDGAVQVALGMFHTLVLLGDGTARAWGLNALDGVLGNADPLTPHPTPEVLPRLAHAKRIATSDKAACAVLDGGAVQCWGTRALGPKGPVSTRDPTPVPGVAGAVDVGVGAGFACALLADHSVRCWGENDYGQLAQGDTKPVDHVVKAHVRDVASLHVRGSSACAIDRSGALFCWGANGVHQLGVLGGPRAAPFLHESLAGIVAADIDGRACAASFAYELYCWGEDVWSPTLVPW